ncbi:unnamed protein product [Protopolystoma xenopodis]|uniref:Kinase n=1 Tax=Protopolystoma xenopodis TaxID=117903 RepID=A0A448WW64_9PLAT|nr:unnamed protein product [Protopolystoma xenopodis]
MQDILAELQLPNACDLKIGPITYTPDASISKINTEKSKYLWREEVGFLLTGMKVS